ncbi:MAG TPA: ketoacyl-ACP synthase III [Anaerolineae bacterium]|nr:ketoacyl-ACP synthase III [Anaerolineae bacterium]
MTRYGTIISTGRYVPETVHSNAMLKEQVSRANPDLAKVVDAFQDSSGIRARRLAPREWAASDIAVRAAQAALDKAGITADQVDMILLGTDTPDYITPATSTVVQHKLGAVNAGTYDIGCACASFPTGIATASGLLATNPWMRYVLVIGVYMMSKLADPTDVTSFFYSDGAGAAVLAADDKPGFLSSAYLADGAYHAHWGLYSGGTYEPATVEAVQAGRTNVRLLQRYPPDVNHINWPRIARLLAERGGFDLQDIDLVIFTQVRLPSIKLVMEDLGLPLEKTHWIMEEWGYTGSACIGMALDSAVEQGKVKSGDLVALVGSGVGYNYAGAALRMP